MDHREAKDLLTARLAEYRRLSHFQLTSRIGAEDRSEITGPSGANYQMEVQVRWDSQPGGAIRVLGSIDDGGWGASPFLRAVVRVFRARRASKGAGPTLACASGSERPPPADTGMHPGGWRAFSPLCESLILTPDESS